MLKPGLLCKKKFIDCSERAQECKEGANKTSTGTFKFASRSKAKKSKSLILTYTCNIAQFLWIMWNLRLFVFP